CRSTPTSSSRPCCRDRRGPMVIRAVLLPVRLAVGLTRLGVRTGYAAGRLSVARLGLPADAVVLLFLGKIRRYKGVPELIETFQSIDGGDARLVVAGSPLNPQVEKEVRDAVRSEHVHLHPNFVPDGEIQVYMNAADAVVLPYQDVLTS